jgi:hypothetical protein
MGAALGAAGDLGIKDDFKMRVQDMLQPGTSAIPVIVRKATPDKLLEALRPYGGTVLTTSLTHDSEQQLMRAPARRRQHRGDLAAGPGFRAASRLMMRSNEAAAEVPGQPRPTTSPAASPMSIGRWPPGGAGQAESPRRLSRP